MNSFASEQHFASPKMPEAVRNKRVDTIAAHVARIRKDQGFTQIEMARKLKTTQSVYSRYERGDLRIHADTLIQLASIFGVTPNELCGITPSGGTKKVKTSEETIPKRFLRRLRGVQNLTRTDQDYLLRTIDAFMTVGNDKKAAKAK